MTKETTEVATTETTELSTEVNYGGYEGAGYEDVTGADMKIPFLKVLQTNNPQCNKHNEDYVPGAEPGGVLLTIPETLWDGTTGAVFVPAAIQHVFIEQVPFDQGRGFRGIRMAADPEVASARAAWQATPEGKKQPLANYPTEHGTEFAETYQIFGVVLAEDEVTPVGPFSFGAKGKAIGPFKSWLTTIYSYRHNGKPVPLFAHLGRLTTHYEKNDKGEFFVPKFTPAFNRQVKDSLVAPGTALFEQAHELHEIVNSGRVAQESYGDAPDTDPVSNDDIPF